LADETGGRDGGDDASILCPYLTREAARSFAAARKSTSFARN
jgi:hypothetical protein